MRRQRNFRSATKQSFAIAQIFISFGWNRFSGGGPTFRNAAL
jgi:hypothetical protein